MATDEELITRIVHGCFEAWDHAGVACGRWLAIGIADVCGSIVSTVVRPAPHREYVHLIGTGGEWTMARELWRRQ